MTSQAPRTQRTQAALATLGLITLAQAAALLGCSTATVHRRIRDRELIAQIVLGRTLLDRDAVEVLARTVNS